ncbi:MAG: 2,3-bisphosphoglycerate-dependent phosphoglycerate mutase [Desulfobacteraceae bacterium]
MAKLVLLRHGESFWNKKNIFTGWVDVPLSRNGIIEALDAGEKIADLEFDLIYTSLQIRAIETALIAMTVNTGLKTPVIIHKTGKMKHQAAIYSDATQTETIPVYCDWRLNERFYGELQGKNKAETAAVYGSAQILKWRRSYDVSPPGGESLKNTAERTIPFFTQTIVKELAQKKNILISAHGNSLRSIVMFIDQLTPDEVIKLEIPTGVPLFYEYSNDTLKKLNSDGGQG